MGQAAAPISAAMSLASVGMNAAGDYMKGKGTQAADEYQAKRLERAAEYGRVSAAQTSAVLTERLNTTLGNIEAVRSAGHADPTSPTGIAIEDRASFLGERSKNIQVGNILGQVAQEESDAAYMRYAGTQALLMGKMAAATDIFKGLGSAVASPGFGFGKSGGGGIPYPPDDI